MIDLTYTDAEGTDQGILRAYRLDLAYGSDENDFELTLPNGVPLEEKARVYIEGTEWGGIVRGGRESTLDSDTVSVATGETWHGTLASTYVCSNEDLEVSGEANDALRTVIASVGLRDVFDVSPTDSGIHVSHRFRLAEEVYAGIREMLAASGAKLRIVKEAGNPPILSAVPVGMYIDADDLGKYGYELAWETPVNHLICIGSDEGAEGVLLHLFADAEGVVGDNQTQFGIDERQYVYEGSSGNGELREAGEQKLRELQRTGTCELSLPEGAEYDVGDVVGVVSEKSGISLTATVAKVIVKVAENGEIELTNEIGEVTSLRR